MQIFVGHILYTDPHGYVQETKLMQNMDAQKAPAVGEEISTFYHEKVPFFNIVGCLVMDTKYMLVKNKEFYAVEQPENSQKIRSEFIKYLSMIKNIRNEDIHGKRLTDTSLFEDVMVIAKKVMDINSKDLKWTNFSEEKYKETFNNLIKHMYASNIRHLAQIIKPVMNSFNTLLAYHENLKDFSSASHAFYFHQDEDGENANLLDISMACRNVRTKESTASYLYATPAIKNIKTTPKETVKENKLKSTKTY